MKTKLNKLGLLAVIAGLLVISMTAVAAEKCPICSTEPKGALFLVTLEDGKQIAYGCLGCAFMDLEPAKLAKAQAADFMSRKLVEARKAFYVKDTSYGECCFNLLAFASKQHAINFAKGFGGEVLTFDQVMKTLRK